MQALPHPTARAAPPLLALLLLVTCGDDGGPAGQPTIEIGTGALHFEELQDNQELVLIAGLQGGYHLVVNARAENLLPGNPSSPGELGNPITTFVLLEEGGRRIDAQLPPYRLGYRPAEGGGYELPSGRILQIDPTLVDEEGLVPGIYGMPVTVRVEVEDARGGRASDQKVVVPIPQADAGATPDAGPSIDAAPG